MTEKLILTLIDKFTAASMGTGGSLAELDLTDGTSHLVLRNEAAFRSGGASDGPGAGSGVQAEVRLGLPVNAEAAGPAGEQITSPIVATFYASPGPDAPAFVKAGDTLCILEAMKMMNHLEAEFDCEILQVHAGTGELVEYGQTLFSVNRL
jgi:acetyl-CoA carboxylase biotin carboxyl carrier protein